MERAILTICETTVEVTFLVIPRKEKIDLVVKESRYIHSIK